ncbi:dihydroxyacetone kinase phosphoryl donor subunit DhaM [Marisediminicola sp. LYQ134]|uniref:dihydroxyacetone kinase phosphoryl donor subunit DhaM n=1 Tax=Marisediminicola sp. LYQ134 TaxID=3391061 RepID=UPI003983493F
MTVGLVVVSHSALIAEGIRDLASQMASTTRIVPAGGTDDGGIGTSFDAVSAAMTDADDGDGVVVLCDLGSAILTAETALDFLDDDVRARVRIADAPVVEGAVAAAVAAETGQTLDEVVAAAESANRRAPEAELESAARSDPRPEVDDAAAAVSQTVTLRNRDGLHARPAAEFVKLASRFDADVEVNGVDAKSLLRIMSLGLAAGREATIVARGPAARDAVDALVDLVESAFGEP